MQRTIPSLVLGLVLSLSLSATGGAPVSAAEGAPVQARWTRAGFDEMRAIAPVDIEGDGSDEVLAAGTGIVAIDAQTWRTRRARWEMKWNHLPDDVLSGGERPRSSGAELVEIPGLAGPQLLVTAENASAYLVDAASGEQRWFNPSTGAHNDRGFALVDADEDGAPDFLPSGSRTVYSGATGAALWTADEVPTKARLVTSGEFDGKPGRDVALTIAPPGAGTNPTTIPGAITSPTLFVYSGRGGLLYDFVPVAAMESLAAVDVDGDGVDELAYGTYNGTVSVLGAGGTPRWSSSLGGGPITAMIGDDVDGDGRVNLIAAAESSPETSTATTRVTAFDGAGAALWGHPIDHRVSTLETVADVGDRGRLLLVGAGAGTNADGGLALALETDLLTTARERWRVPTDRVVLSLARSVQEGRELALIGAADAVLRAVDLGTGELVSQYIAGGFTSAVSTGDVDGNGIDEVATGDDEGRLSLTSAAGEQVWTHRLPVAGNGLIPAVAFGDVDGDRRDEIAAVGQRLGADDRGVVVVTNAHGSRMWAQFVPGAVEDVAVVDLDGDGRGEVVVAEGRTVESNDCAVSAFEGATGQLRWRTPMSSCIAPFIDAEADDGTGRPAIAYGNLTLFEVPQVAMLNADGTIRWSHQISQSTAWLEIVDGGVVHGGFAGRPGHVTRRDAAGQVMWQAFPDHEDGGGASRFGVLIDTATGFDVVTGTDAGVWRLDGASGAVRWTTQLEPEDTVATQAHQGGPVAVLERPDAAPLLIAAEYAINRKRARTFALDLDGVPLWSAPMEGDAHAIAVGRFRPGVDGVAVGAGLGLYSYEPAGAHLAGSVLSLSLRKDGGAVTATAVLTDEDGRPLSGRVIAFAVNDVDTAEATTDASGSATLVLRRQDVPSGTRVTARFAGDEAYAPSSAEAVAPKRW